MVTLIAKEREKKNYAATHQILLLPAILLAAYIYRF
jgi:hypothetical protein